MLATFGRGFTSANRDVLDGFAKRNVASESRANFIDHALEQESAGSDEVLVRRLPFASHSLKKIRDNPVGDFDRNGGLAYVFGREEDELHEILPRLEKLLRELVEIFFFGGDVVAVFDGRAEVGGDFVLEEVTRGVEAGFVFFEGRKSLDVFNFHRVDSGVKKWNIRHFVNYTNFSLMIFLCSKTLIDKKTNKPQSDSHHH